MAPDYLFVYLRSRLEIPKALVTLQQVCMHPMMLAVPQDLEGLSNTCPAIVLIALLNLRQHMQWQIG